MLAKEYRPKARPRDCPLAFTSLPAKSSPTGGRPHCTSTVDRLTSTTSDPAGSNPQRNRGPRSHLRVPDPEVGTRNQALADDIVASEKLSNLLGRGVRRGGAMDGILADRFGEDLAARVARRLGGVGRAHDVAVARDGVLAFQDLHHHRARRHELHELTEERPRAVDGVEGLRLFAADAHALLRNDAQPRLLDHRVDRSGEITRGRVWLDDRKGTLDCHREGHHKL